MHMRSPGASFSDDLSQRTVAHEVLLCSYGRFEPPETLSDEFRSCAPSPPRWPEGARPSLGRFYARVLSFPALLKCQSHSTQMDFVLQVDTYRPLRSSWCGVPF